MHKMDEGKGEDIFILINFAFLIPLKTRHRHWLSEQSWPEFGNPGARHGHGLFPPHRNDANQNHAADQVGLHRDHFVVFVRKWNTVVSLGLRKAGCEWCFGNSELIFWFYHLASTILAGDLLADGKGLPLAVVQWTVFNGSLAGGCLSRA